MLSSSCFVLSIAEQQLNLSRRTYLVLDLRGTVGGCRGCSRTWHGELVLKFGGEGIYGNSEFKWDTMKARAEASTYKQFMTTSGLSQRVYG